MRCGAMQMRDACWVVFCMGWGEGHTRPFACPATMMAGDCWHGITRPVLPRAHAISQDTGFLFRFHRHIITVDQTTSFDPMAVRQFPTSALRSRRFRAPGLEVCPVYKPPIATADNGSRAW